MGVFLQQHTTIKDWAFDLNYGVSRSKSWNQEGTWSNHLYNGKLTMIEDDMRRISQNWSNTIFASASYKTLKLTYNGQIVSGQKSRGLSSGTLGNYTNAYNMLSPSTIITLLFAMLHLSVRLLAAIIPIILKAVPSHCFKDTDLSAWL